MGLIVASRPDGLGTRLMTILCARRLAERFGFDFLFLWPSLNDTNYDLSSNLLQKESFMEIFSSKTAFGDTNAQFGLLAEDNILEGKRILSLQGEFGQTWAAQSDEFLRRAAEFDIILYDSPNLIQFDNQSQENDLKLIKAYWKRFNFNKAVMDQLGQFSMKSNLEKSPAIHMRRGDVATMICEEDFNVLKSTGITMIFQRYMPLQTIFDIIEKNFSHERSFVICTEDAALVGYFAIKFPHKIFYSSHGIFDASSNYRALLDLLILSQARVLISPFKSFYSECASFVGDCEHIRSPLDISNLIIELSSIIDSSSASNKSELKVLLLTMGWRNLWYIPDSQERRLLLHKAINLNKQLTNELLLDHFESISLEDNNIYDDIDNNSLTNSEKDNKTPTQVLPSYPNIALGRPATQSSLSQWSSVDDASGGNNGVKTGAFGFHTERETNPWWQVDLLQNYLIYDIWIFNRLDSQSDRARMIQVHLSTDGEMWFVLHDQGGQRFGDPDGHPLKIKANGRVARYVRIQMVGVEYLHLDEIEVYGESLQSPSLD